MANYQAISAVSDAIAYLLQSRYSPDDFTLPAFNGAQLEFRALSARDFAQGGRMIKAGVSVFLYRIYANTINRTPAGRLDPDGHRRRTQLPLDLHFLLTAWAQDATMEHAIAGWMMRILEDTPILPAGLLNHNFEVFHPDESVDLSLAEMDTETLVRIWELIATHDYHISVPYVARNVRIESGLTVSEGKPVQERVFDYQQIVRER